MSDPHIKPEMDGLDYLMVVLYRIGMVISGLGLLSLAADVLGFYTFHQYPLWLLALDGALQASSLHIYDKVIRWLLANATWVGLLVIVIDGGDGGWIQSFGLGCLFVTLSGLAFKESFCFRIPGLKLVPLALAFSWFALVVDLPVYAGSILFPAAGLYFFMALRKAQMPLHFDIGDKAAYQICFLGFLYGFKRRNGTYRPTFSSSIFEGLIHARLSELSDIFLFTESLE